MKNIIAILLLLVSIAGCGPILRYAVSESFYSSGEEFDVTPEEAGLEYVDAEFENTDGDILNGWLIPGKQGYPLVIYFHGNVSNITHGLEIIELLNQLGFSVFSFEYRGFGKSEGHPLFEDDFYRDARSAMWWLEKRGWDRRDMIYYGHSLGAAVALSLALEAPPMGIVLESAFTSYADMFKYRAPYLYIFGGWNARQFNNIAKISKIKKPIIFFHGASDEIVPMYMSKELYAATQSPKKLHLVKNANHTNSVILAPKALEEDLNWILSMQQDNQVPQ